MPGYNAVFVSGTETDSYPSTANFSGGLVVASGQVASFVAADSVFEGGIKVPQALTLQGTYIQLSATALSNTLLPLWVADNSYQVTSIRGRNSVVGGASSTLIFNKVVSNSTMVIGSGVTLMNSFYDLTISIGSSFSPALLGSAINSNWQANLTFAPGDWLIMTPVGNGNPISSWQMTLQRI